MNTRLISRLLSGEPWTAYRTRLDLLEEPLNSTEVLKARAQMIFHPAIVTIIDELSNWPGTVLNSHKSASQSFHKLSFIADLGFTRNDPGISEIIEQIFERTSDEGPFQLPMNIPVHYGGTGDEQYAWALCDAPIIVYSLAKMGFQHDKRVIKAKDYLVSLGRENGYPCVVSKELGKFRGPGKKDDPCPYATMIMLKLINLYDDDRESEVAKNALESMLNLWEQSNKLHPYMFFMGTDFRKLKAPLIWYDIIHFADTLSNFQYARNDLRFKNLIDFILHKADSNGLFTPESVWTAWKNWDFGQKKQPSLWLTFLVYRITKRMGQL